MNAPKLMLLGTSDPFSQGAVEYAVALAQRMGCEIIAVHLSDPPPHATAPLPSLSDAQFGALALEAGVVLSHHSQGGSMSQSLPMLCHEVKRLSLIVADAGLCVEHHHIHPTIPVVEFCTDFKPKTEGVPMTATSTAGNRKGFLFKTVITGIMSVSLYTLLFMNEQTIMLWFTKGGAYAAFPILTAFLFSLVHGAFTGNIWSLLGVQPKASAPAAREGDNSGPSFPGFGALKAKANA